MRSIIGYAVANPLVMTLICLVKHNHHQVLNDHTQGRSQKNKFVTVTLTVRVDPPNPLNSQLLAKEKN